MAHKSTRVSLPAAALKRLELRYGESRAQRHAATPSPTTAEVTSRATPLTAIASPAPTPTTAE
eukprot:7019959-Prymnesium_polylepis.1